MQIDGACHCGNLRFALEWPVDSGPASHPAIPARACGCTFCRKHGATWTSHPGATLYMTAQDDAQVARYAFGTRSADFLVCKRCGGVPAAISTIEGRTYAVVNINLFEGVDEAWFDRSRADFEGESTQDRLARRQSRWIADVRFD